MKAIILWIKRTVGATSNGKVETVIEDVMSMMKGKALVKCAGLTVRFTEGGGTKGCSMGLE